MRSAAQSARARGDSGAPMRCGSSHRRTRCVWHGNWQKGDDCLVTALLPQKQRVAPSASGLGRWASVIPFRAKTL